MVRRRRHYSGPGRARHAVFVERAREPVDLVLERLRGPVERPRVRAVPEERGAHDPLPVGETRLHLVPALGQAQEPVQEDVRHAPISARESAIALESARNDRVASSGSTIARTT